MLTEAAVNGNTKTCRSDSHAVPYFLHPAIISIRRKRPPNSRIRRKHTKHKRAAYRKRIERADNGGRYDYQCDLNNDGVLEHYNKDVWTEVEGDLIYLHSSSEGSAIEEAVRAMGQSVEGSAVMMWAEPFAGENIINIISVTEQEGFEITGFLLNGTEYKKQYRITADVVYGVRQSRIYT